MNIVPNYSSPQHVDYEAVNGLLQTVMPAALQVLAAGILGQLAQDTGKIGRLLAFWNVCKARDLAWDFSGHLRGMNGVGTAGGVACSGPGYGGPGAGDSALRVTNSFATGAW